MAVTLKDIARIAQVSESTVSLALSNKAKVKEDTRKRINNIARELGYTPNAIAQGLATRRTHTVGLVVPDIENAYYGKLIRYTDQYISEMGYRLVISTSNDTLEVERLIIRGFVAQRVEGILLAPVNIACNNHTDYFKQLDINGIPYIYVSSYYPELPAPYVMVNLEEGTYKLIKYLLDIGHKKIMFLIGSPQMISSKTRITGYIRAFTEKGMTVDEKNFIECKHLNYEHAYETTVGLVNMRKNFDGIVAVNDAMAMGVINALRDHGIKVPADVSVAGFDDMLFSRISRIPITTVLQDIPQMSRHAVRMLMEQINNGVIGSRDILIKPELVIRDSTGSKQ